MEDKNVFLTVSIGNVSKMQLFRYLTLVYTSHPLETQLCSIVHIQTYIYIHIHKYTHIRMWNGRHHFRGSGISIQPIIKSGPIYHRSVCQFSCMPVCLFVYTVSQFVCLSVCLSIGLFLGPFYARLCLSSCLSICLSVCLSVCLSIWESKKDEQQAPTAIVRKCPQKRKT